MARSNDDGVGLVEFLVEEKPGGGEDGDRVTLSAIAPGAVAFRTRWRLVTELVAAAGAAGAAASVFLPQLVVRFGHASYAVNGFGHYRVLVANPRIQLMGHAPPLGAVTLVAGLLLLIVVCADRFGPSHVSAIAGVLAGVLAGALAGAFACLSVEATGWPDSSWSYGWWLSGASALCAVVGTGAAHVGRPKPTGDRQSPDCS